MNRRIPVLLGMDGGGTGTQVLLADAEGHVVGQGFAGPSNIKAVGEKAAMRELDVAVLSAFQNAGIEPCRIEVSCLGLAGFDRPEDREWLRRWADQSAWARELILVNDGDLVVAAGTEEGWGVGVIAGTGSIAIGRAADGTKGRAGGWGHLIGDEGSGYGVALQALRRVARFADGRDPRGGKGHDPLTERICLSLGIAGPGQLISTLYSEKMTRARIASLAIDVLAAAELDPSIQDELLEPAGRELARTVVAVAHQIGITRGLLPLAMAGGFLLGSGVISRILINRVREAGYEVTPTPVPRPVEGALALARQALLG